MRPHPKAGYMEALLFSHYGKLVLASRGGPYMSQPAISMALSELETHLNSQLFDRTSNRLILNSEGKKLLPLACEL
ncbi:LysR family transcriptional regulator, partial [uncultured Idiomarina sp.]|uniref:LysR family transcriptional regulator n=1 Tax=uncultured Idiomarina sp. TaxID=352961 RepID=UPI00338F26DA